jgi:cytochrome c oxidase subunit IV
MSTTPDATNLVDSTEHAIDDRDVVEAGEYHEEHSNAYYIRIALILAVITAIETSTYWIDFGPLFLPTLLILMAIKFLMVVSVFMHLKFDNPIFSYLFYTGLILAIGVYVAALASFHFFTPG